MTAAFGAPATLQADRDTAAWEAEQLRARNSELDAQLQASRADADEQRAAKDDAQAALARARSRIDELSEQVLDAAAVISTLTTLLLQPAIRVDACEALKHTRISWQGQPTTASYQVSRAASFDL